MFTPSTLFVGVRQNSFFEIGKNLYCLVQSRVGNGINKQSSLPYNTPGRGTWGEGFILLLKLLIFPGHSLRRIFQVQNCSIFT